jgi:putative transposase
VFPYLLYGVGIERLNRSRALDITYIPMAHSFVCLAGVMDWFSRRVLAWRALITMEVDFYLDAVDETLARHGRPEIFNKPCGCEGKPLSTRSEPSRPGWVRPTSRRGP